MLNSFMLEKKRWKEKTFRYNFPRFFTRSAKLLDFVYEMFAGVTNPQSSSKARMTIFFYIYLNQKYL